MSRDAISRDFRVSAHGTHGACKQSRGRSGDGNEEPMAQLAELVMEPRFIQLVVLALSVGLATLARKG